MGIGEYLNSRNTNLALIAEAIKAKAIKSRSKKVKADPTLSLLTAISALSPEELDKLKEDLKNA